MSEIILGLVIFSLLGVIVYLTKTHREEVDKLTRVVIAKNLTDYTTNSIIEKDKPKKETPEPDLVPIEQVDDKTFLKAIKT
jgi:hypothetical protein